MTQADNIQEFHALLTSEPARDDDSLLNALRDVRRIEPEQIAALAESPMQSWSNWKAVSSA
jgi:hypothetical protein